MHRGGPASTDEVQHSTNAPRATGVVLAGAAALGAYEVGVLSHVIETVGRDIGPTMPQVLVGTSAGAINAATLASFADAPIAGVRMLVRAWSELRLDRILRPSSVELLSMLLDVAGAPARLRRALRVHSIRGGVLDPAPIARLVAAAPIARIGEHLAAGRLRGVAISATRVSTGGAVVFHQGAAHMESWSTEPNVIAIESRLTAHHVLASAAIPLLFPAVAIDGDTYCDGGLRQMVPLSPALHLGADRLLVVNPLPAAVRAEPDPRAPVTSPLYLAGKALNALFADRVDADLARLNHTTAILRAGRRRYGPSFEHEINLELAREGGAQLRAVDALCIEPSRDLGVLAAEHVASRAFASSTSGSASRLLRCVADGDPRRAGDLLAYLLFDGAFTAALIELGRDDARARHEELCALFSPTTTPARIAAGTGRPIVRDHRRRVR